MGDQASSLRQLLQQQQPSQKQRMGDSQTPTCSIAVLSGKGGVGKTNVSVNLGIALTELNYSVLLVDMDIGMGNIDAMVGTYSTMSMADLLRGSGDVSTLIQPSLYGIDIIAGGSALAEELSPDEDVVQLALGELEERFSKYDFVLFDLGAGISKDRVPVLTSVDRIIGVTVPEPPALTDLYSALKWVHHYEPMIPIQLIVNKAVSEKEGLAAAERIQAVAKRFLQKEVELLGVIREDPAVVSSVKAQVPFVCRLPKAMASQAVRGMARKLTLQPSAEEYRPSFIQRLSQRWGGKKRA
ncbi:P-loop NTPase [Aureibacillus halotolerans]|uniref:Flagellar biosynthesis protein FlhG n=1 Tax=Aureibacillus halotolerans TaxID=1508390 RepID=A0A4R6U214_9BACI|nr:P-loop NTPase [Aureibacillus halotolerans]TDQ39666.1 flagellar biosynthesis protein FlhG [Aureibacillus halotolerans]